MAEFSYASGSSKWYFNRIGITVWHSDKLLESDQSWLVCLSSKGFTIQGTWIIKEKYIPIFTFGLSDGDGANSLSKLNISMIHGWYFKSHDLLGVGLNYTESTITGKSQLGSEVFYRFTLPKAISITPTIKAIINPALDPNRDFLGYWGVRTRISM